MKASLALLSALLLTTTSALPVSPAQEQSGQPQALILPRVDFRAASIIEVAHIVAAQTRKLGPRSAFNIVVIADPTGLPKVTIQAENQNPLETIKAAAEQAGCKVQKDAHAVIILRKGAAPVPPLQIPAGAEYAKMETSLRAAKFPRVEFKEASVRECLDFVIRKYADITPETRTRIEAKLPEVNATAAAPKVQPIPGLNSGPGAAPAIPADHGPQITILASDLPAIDIVRYAAAAGGLEVTMEKTGIVVAPPGLKSTPPSR